MRWQILVTDDDGSLIAAGPEGSFEPKGYLLADPPPGPTEDPLAGARIGTTLYIVEDDEDDLPEADQRVADKVAPWAEAKAKDGRKPVIDKGQSVASALADITPKLPV